MSTLGREDTRKIEVFLASHPRLAVGLGHVDKPCSVAAINLALTGELTDRIPDCMSEVVGAWIIDVQDVMPAVVRNSARWRRLLPQAAGTGRDHEKERLNVILDWMWDTVLPLAQSRADEHGLGSEWRKMSVERTKEAAIIASRVAGVVFIDGPVALAASAAADAFRALEFAETGLLRLAANHAVYCALEIATLFPFSIRDEYWKTLDPAGLLKRLIKIGEQE